MNFKRKNKITSKRKNKIYAKRRVKNDVKATERTRDGMRAVRRNYGEGLGL